MKRIFLFPAIIVFLFSCSGDPHSKFKGKLTQKFLTGTWIAADVDFPASKKSYDVSDSLSRMFAMLLLRFDADGKIFSDRCDSLPQTGTYEVEDRALKITLSPEKKFYYSLDKATDSSVILIFEKNPDMNFEEGKISLRRIDTALYPVGNPTWKQRPASPLSDEAVRKKLQDMLIYYEQFLLALDSRKIFLYSFRPIPLPFYYMDSEIDMKPFESREGWDVFFGDSTHSRKAYDMLRKCFYNVYYKNSDVTRFKQYAHIFGVLAKNLNTLKK